MGEPQFYKQSKANPQNAMRSKSARELYAQTERLMDEAAKRGWNGREYSADSLRRVERVYNINRRYIKNVASSFGRSDDYISNSDFERKVNRRTYMGR